MTDLVIGANGLIGSALMGYLDALGTFRNHRENLLNGKKYRPLDISDSDDVKDVFDDAKPQRVFLAAGVASVDSCETLESDRTNSFGVSNIITNCDTHGAQLIFFSSSYVFDGKSQTPYKPHDPTSPIQRYGRQKEATEKILLSRDGLQFLIIRTDAVFGKGNNFVSQVAGAVRAGKKIHVPVDQTVNPVFAPDLARTAIHLSERYSGEIFHVAGNKCVTYYDFAVQIAYKLGCPKPHDLIMGIKLEDMQQLARRPQNACLDCKTLEAHAMTVPNLEKGLKKFLES